MIRCVLASRRWVSNRCIDYLEKWVWEPHSDGFGYYEELIRRPIKDQNTGIDIHVMGVNYSSEDNAKDVKDLLSETEWRKGNEVEVCLDSPGADVILATQDCLTSEPEKRSQAVLRASSLGLPPDFIAKLVLNNQKHGLKTCLPQVAAAATCLRKSIPVRYLGLPQRISFSKKQLVNAAVQEHLCVHSSNGGGGVDGTNEEYSIHDVTVGDMGLHADENVHVIPSILADKIKSRATPSTSLQQIESLDLPTLFFSIIQPTVHLVRRVQDQAIISKRSNESLKRILVIVDAQVASLFYRVYKDIGLTKDDCLGISYDFESRRDKRLSLYKFIDGNADDDKKYLSDSSNPNPSFHPDSPLAVIEQHTDDQESLTEDAQQAEFDVQIILFLYLAKIRPEVLHFHNAISNVYITHGMIGASLSYLKFITTKQNVPGSAGVLNAMIDDLIENNFLDPDDDIVDEFRCDATRQTEEIPIPILIEAPNKAVKRMVMQDSNGRQVTSPSEIPNAEEYTTGALTGGRSLAVADALSEYKKRELSKVTPSSSMMNEMAKNEKQVDSVQFSIPHHSPSHRNSPPGEQRVAHGEVKALKRYQPNSDFPAPPIQKIEHEENSRALATNIARRRTHASPITSLLKDAVRTRTSSPARTQDGHQILKERKQERIKKRKFNFGNRNDQRWTKYYKSVANQAGSDIDVDPNFPTR